MRALGYRVLFYRDIVSNNGDSEAPFTEEELRAIGDYFQQVDDVLLKMGIVVVTAKVNEGSVIECENVDYLFQWKGQDRNAL